MSQTESFHVVEVSKIGANLYRVSCSCGAHWSINEKEYAAGFIKLDDHEKYFNRPLTKVD